MKKGTVIIFVMVLIIMLEIFYIKPIIAPYYAMKSSWQTLYLLLVYGFPVLILIPISLFTIPFAYYLNRKRDFMSKFLPLLKKTYRVILIVFLILGSLLSFSKVFLKNEPFPKVKFASLSGTPADCSDLKTGKFKGKFKYIERFADKQLEISFNYKDTTVYQIVWLDRDKYRLIYQGPPRGMDDTIDVIITNNEATLYDCWLRFGEYAQHQRIQKIKSGF